MSAPPSHRQTRHDRLPTHIADALLGWYREDTVGRRVPRELPATNRNGHSNRNAKWPLIAQQTRMLSGAGNGTRTRDIKLGKLALYQLSYSRPRRRGIYQLPHRVSRILEMVSGASSVAASIHFRRRSFRNHVSWRLAYRRVPILTWRAVSARSSLPSR